MGFLPSRGLVEERERAHDEGLAGTSLDGRGGMAGGVLAHLAAGCPTCNKIALLAPGASGAIRWFAPVQPFLAVLGVLLLTYALRRRLGGERSGPITPDPISPGEGTPARTLTSIRSAGRSSRT